MKCEPVLRNTYTLRETGRNHPPADRTESGAGAKNHPEARAQVCGNGSPPEKKQEWQKKYNAGQACQQAMRPFPPIDDLESVQVHAAVELLVLRDRLVFREFGLPRGLRERRQHNRNRLPFDDGQPRLSQPRRTADDQRQKDHCSRREQPEPHGAQIDV
jgi:hypothetical protein